MAQADLRFASPCDSPGFQKLIKLAEQAGIDVALLRRILWLVTAHSELIALPTAASRLIRIFEDAPSAWNAVMDETGVNQWRPVLEWLVSNRAELERDIGKRFGRESNTTGNNPVMGSGATEFPIYACLCEPLPQEPYDKPYLLLSGHLLLAYVSAMQDRSSQDEYENAGADLKWKFLENRPDTAALAVRRLSEPKYSSRLDDLPLDLEPEEFVEALGGLQHDTDPKIHADRWNLERFLQKCWGLLAWVNRHGEGGGGGGWPQMGRRATRNWGAHRS